MCTFQAAHGIFQLGWLRSMGIPVGGTEGGSLGIQAMTALGDIGMRQSDTKLDVTSVIHMLNLMQMTLRFRVRTLFHGLAPRLLSAVPSW